MAAQIGRSLPDAGLLICFSGAGIDVAKDRLKHKELFESFEVASLAHKTLGAREGCEKWRPRMWQQRQLDMDIVDLCTGCGLVGLFLALLTGRKVVCMDRKRSRLATEVHHKVAGHFPGLREQIEWRLQDLRPTGGKGLHLPNSLLVACHACGLLSDEVIALASFKVLRPLILLPCCYPLKPKVNVRHDVPSFSWLRFPWLRRGAVNLQGPDAVDAARIRHLEGLGYEVQVDFIDKSITPHSKAIVAVPRALKRPYEMEA